MLNFDAGTSNAFIRLDHTERERDERVVPEDHFPRRWNRLVDFQRFLPLLNQEPLETRSSSGIGCHAFVLESMLWSTKAWHSNPRSRADLGLAKACSPDTGRKPLDSLVLLKCAIRAFHERLSDRELLVGGRFDLTTARRSPEEYLLTF